MSARFPRQSLVKALRPFVRLLLAKGIGYSYLSDLLKEIFVDVAVREFAIDGKAQTDSRISLLTGIHRKDVKRLRAMEPDAHEPPPSTVSLGMRVVSAWSMPPYADEAGIPQPLPRLSSQGGSVSFEALVASVCKDIRARALLDEWLRLGVVRIDPENRVALDVAAFVPSKGLEEKAYYFGHNLHDHAAAAVSNILSDRGVFLERSVHHDGLNPELIADLATEAESSGMRLLHSLNRKVLAVEQAPVDGDESSKQRFTFGIYFYSESGDHPEGAVPRD